MVQSVCQKSCRIESPSRLHEVLQGLEITTLPEEPASQETILVISSRLNRRINGTSQALLEVIEAMSNMNCPVLSKIELL